MGVIYFHIFLYSFLLRIINNHRHYYATTYQETDTPSCDPEQRLRNPQHTTRTRPRVTNESRKVRRRETDTE